MTENKKSFNIQFMDANFSSITNTFTVHFGLANMSGHQKCVLFKALLDDLGISDDFHTQGQTKAFEIINKRFEQFSK